MIDFTAPQNLGLDLAPFAPHSLLLLPKSFHEKAG